MSEILKAIECLQRNFYEDYGEPPNKIWISELMLAKLQRELSNEGTLIYNVNNTGFSILGMKIQTDGLLSNTLPEYLLCVGK